MNHGNISAAMESVSHQDGYVMKLMTVVTALMNFLLPAWPRPADPVNSAVVGDSTSVCQRAGSVMAKQTVRTVQMRKAVLLDSVGMASSAAATASV